MTPFSKKPWSANSNQIFRTVEITHRQEFLQAISVAQLGDRPGKLIEIVDDQKLIWDCELDPDAARHLAKLLTEGLPE